jgi:hypothetical protein
MVTSKATKPKKSSVRHTRAIQRDRRTRPTVSPPAPAIQDHLTALIHPATFAQLDHYRALGLRDRILTLPVMVAFVLSLLWRHLGSVSEAVRVLTAEGLLWTSPVQVSQQAMSQRLRTFPAVLFERILCDVLPAMQVRAQARQRPLPPVIARARAHFATIVALDGSTLDALLRQVGLLRDGAGPVLAGRMAGLIDLATHLPHHLWYEPDSTAHDQCFWERILTGLSAGMLVVFDLGFTNYALFDQLTAQVVAFITRAKATMAYRVERVLTETDQVRDRLVWVGTGTGACTHLLRLVEVAHQGRWFRYLTNVLDPAVLAASDVAALYWQRWRIEEAFALVKRLLGLAYFYVGSVNGVKLQVWATWLLYAVLVDLTDAVAEQLETATRHVSIEMVFRGLYHFTSAYQRGEATDPVAYLAANAARLGIRKRKRRSAGARTALTNRDGP